MQHEHHRVPVTALARWNQRIVLAGCGNHVQAYDITTGSPLISIPVFTEQAVHGILVTDAADECPVVVWGGHLLRLLRLTDDSSKLELEYQPGEIAIAQDWILDAAIEPTHARRIAIITAHNALTIANVDSPAMSLALQPVLPGSNCVLYCAHVTWLSPSSCLIASGTAFGDIIVWSCDLSEDEGRSTATHQTHYTFSAHDGSVFGLHVFSMTFTDDPTTQRRILASCSDDRTVRLWDITDLPTKSASLADSQRETGFGSASTIDTAAPTCLSKTMGHISRIWHVKYVATTTPPRLLSFGEDATCITWTLQERSDHMIEMQQTHVQRAHSGKHIWSAAVVDLAGQKAFAADANRPHILTGEADANGPHILTGRADVNRPHILTGEADVNSPHILTGGADGAIAVAEIINDTYKGVQKLQPKVSTAAFRSYTFISKSQVVAITDDGTIELLTWDAAQKSLTSQALATSVDQLRGYSTISSTDDLAFFAGKGQIFYHVQGDIHHHVLADVDGKVASLFAQSTADDGASNGETRHSLLVTTVKSKGATWHQLRREGSYGLAVVRTCALALPVGFVVTSFAVIVECGRQYLTLGSRTGCVAIYAISRQAGDVDPLAVISGVHGIEAITSLQHYSGTLYSSGRDGTFAAHRVAFTSQKPDVQESVEWSTVHQLSLPLGPNIEGAHVTTDGRIRVWGFRGKQFVVFDMSTQREVMAVECGGAHRSFAFHPGTNGGTFLWTKASELFYKHQTQLPYHLLNSGGHGREIKATAMSPTNPALVATGAEDTNIKLQLLVHGTWKCLHTLQKHITGIQHLQWSADGTHLFSSGGVEEFYVWKITSDLPVLALGVVCESAYPHSTTSDLRIMNFDVQDRDNAGFDITMVYSNSTIQKWHYQDKAWTRTARGEYLTACLTQCLPFFHPLSSQHQHGLVTASTDGHLVTWTEEEDASRLTWRSRHKVHQSAILSLISYRHPSSSSSSSSPSTPLLISGGDDNAIGITRVFSPPPSSTKTTSKPATDTLLIPHAHAAAITALLVIHSTEHSFWFVSAGVDQRVKVWRVDFDSLFTRPFPTPTIQSEEEEEEEEEINITLLQNLHSSVADVSSMEVVEDEEEEEKKKKNDEKKVKKEEEKKEEEKKKKKEKKVLICGVGMEVWGFHVDLLLVMGREREKRRV